MMKIRPGEIGQGAGKWQIPTQLSPASDSEHLITAVYGKLH